MLIQILIYLFLANMVGKRAADKNLKRYPYWIWAAIAWFVGQVFGLALVYVFLDIAGQSYPDEFWSGVISFGSGFLFWGILYFYLDRKVKSKPDAFSKIHDIGKDS